MVGLMCGLSHVRVTPTAGGWIVARVRSGPNTQLTLAVIPGNEFHDRGHCDGPYSYVHRPLPMSEAPGKRPLAKKPSSANATPKAEAPKLQKVRSDGYVKPAAAAADAAEAKAAKAANKAAKLKQLEDVSDSPHREQAWTRREAARSTPAAQPP